MGVSVVADGSIEALWDGFVRGDAASRDLLLAQHYDEFRRVARRVLKDDGPQLQIQPTDLAHEAAVRLLKLDRIDWRDRTHFLAMAARVMRQTLIDEVRKFRAQKRQRPLISWWIEPGGETSQTFDMERFDQALTLLAEIDPERARVVELRFYAGLTLEEVAVAMDVSTPTVKRRWASARAWLLAEMGFA